jgi:molybdopterin-binding protein
MRVGDSIIESMITRRKRRGTRAKKGGSVTAVVKATETMISKP